MPTQLFGNARGHTSITVSNLNLICRGLFYALNPASGRTASGSVTSCLPTAALPPSRFAWKFLHSENKIQAT
jgi:hypothetical protein